MSQTPAPQHKRTLPPKMVLILTVVHGCLLSGALMLRQAIAPPLSMCERGLSKAWDLAGAGRGEAGARVAVETLARMRERYGPGSHEVSLALQVVGELSLRRGDFAQAEDAFRELSRFRYGARAPDGSWLATEAPPTRSFRRRPRGFGEDWTVELPDPAGRLAAVEAARAAAGEPGGAPSPKAG